MSNIIVETILSLWQTGRKIKHSPSGWISGNAVCCHHNGENADTRSRGGLIITKDNTAFTWHCFNCNFKAGWSPGHNLSKNTKKLFSWMGLSDTEISKLNLYTLQNQEQSLSKSDIINFTLEERKLPHNTKPVNEWILENKYNDQLLDIIKYITQERKFNWDWFPWHWSPEPGYADRVLIPFYQNNKIVGWTGRKIVPGKPKYLSEAQPGYIFNIDNQSHDRKYVIVTEGQFDAIGIDGIGIMHNKPNETQITRINNLNKEVIVVPDKDKPGSELVKIAVEQGWNVSLPPWDNHIKDVGDAVKQYGRIYTLYSILNYKESNKLKIQLIQKKLENL